MSSSKDILKYMVEITIPQPLSAELINVIPQQRKIVKSLFNSSVILSYTLNEYRTKLWMVVLADSESELINILDSLPIIQYVDYDYSRLLFHEAVHLLPSVSLN